MERLKAKSPKSYGFGLEVKHCGFAFVSYFSLFIFHFSFDVVRISNTISQRNRQEA